MKLCLVTKNKFYLDANNLISDGLLWYEEYGISGFKFEEIEKLVLIGFKVKEKFDGYVYNWGSKNGIFIIGPNFREEKRYIFDRLINIFFTLKEIWKNRKILKDIDLVFAPFFEYVAFEFLLLKLICEKAKFIVYIIGDYPELNYRKKKNKFLKYFLLVLQKISQKIANENWILSQYLLKKYRTNKSVLVRTSSLKESQIGLFKTINPKEIKLIFVGRLAEEKNPHTSIFVLKALREKGYSAFLKIVGDGDLKNYLLDLANKLNLKNYVNFYGWMKDFNKIIELYSQSDILIFPSRPGEGLGLVVLEAISQGLVVIATKCGGPEEIIEDGINGYLIDYKEDEKCLIDEFVNKIEFLIKNPQIYEQISKNNIEKAKEWTIEKFSKIQRERILKLLKNE